MPSVNPQLEQRTEELRLARDEAQVQAATCWELKQSAKAVEDHLRGLALDEVHIEKLLDDHAYEVSVPPALITASGSLAVCGAGSVRGVGQG